MKQRERERKKVDNSRQH